MLWILLLGLALIFLTIDMLIIWSGIYLIDKIFLGDVLGLWDELWFAFIFAYMLNKGVIKYEKKSE